MNPSGTVIFTEHCQAVASRTTAKRLRSQEFGTIRLCNFQGPFAGQPCGRFIRELAARRRAVTPGCMRRGRKRTGLRAPRKALLASLPKTPADPLGCRIVADYESDSYSALTHYPQHDDSGAHAAEGFRE